MSARMRRIELAEMRMPRPRSSPWTRTQPQRRFSRAIRTMSSTSSSLMGGRPGPRVDRPIHRAVGDAHIELALEDQHLVAEHHDLDVPVRLGPRRGSEQAEDPTKAEVTEGEGHDRSWSLAANTASAGQRSRFWCPTTAAPSTAPTSWRPIASDRSHRYTTMVNITPPRRLRDAA